MKIGDILHLEPTLEATSGLGTNGPIPCTVVYIHPQRRFYVVEFTSLITGEKWRETMYFPLEENRENFFKLPIIGGRRG